MNMSAGVGDLGDLLEARRRIVAAFEGIAAGAEALASAAAEAGELDSLRAALEEERTANAQLEERIRALRDRGPQPVQPLAADDGRAAALEAECARLRAEIDALHAEREAERGELDAVLRELIPLVEDAR